jgi:hypothetical protein
MDSWNFGMGVILVAWWASREFQAPYAPGYIYDRTDSQRYFLGLAVFVLGAWMAYLLLWNLTRTIHDDFGLLERVSGLTAIVATVIVLPTLPLISTVIVRFRSFAHDLAGFPQDVDHLILSLCRPAATKAEVATNFDVRLKQFGFSLDDLEIHFSPSCVASILEAQRVQDKLTQCQSRTLGEGGLLWHQIRRYWETRLYRYLNRRQEAIARLDRDYFQLLYRAARVIKLADDNPLSDRQRRHLSAFLADQAENVIARYQKLAAQTALAVFAPGDRRKRFLEALGYTVPIFPPSLPLWPIAAVLAIDILTSGLGFIYITYAGGSNGAPFRILAPIISAHGLAMTAAVFWAIAPKVMWSWARPSLSAMPVMSYALFGLVSYGCGLIFFLATSSGFGWPSSQTPQGPSLPAVAMLLLPPGLFAVTSAVLSWRIDRRIIASSHGHGRMAIHDAIWLVAATILFSIFFRTVAHFGFGTPWSSLVSRWLIWPVLGSTALVLGFAVPGWAAAYIYPSANALGSEHPSPGVSNLGNDAEFDGPRATLADDAEVRAKGIRVRA